MNSDLRKWSDARARETFRIKSSSPRLRFSLLLLIIYIVVTLLGLRGLRLLGQC